RGSPLRAQAPLLPRVPAPRVVFGSMELSALAPHPHRGGGAATRPVALVPDPPDRARRGLGRGLMEHLAEFAARGGVPALTLTTFTEVPWNAPYYVRCGFRLLDDAGLTPGLREIRDREAAHGLDRWPRACMRRDL
ncbi:GNAT family N-acetyltransferase, partial [Streptomyces sp. NPDC059538]|uniref:GNAT family N-acetyltransferase n=1 Tax=Streptomyces sp. NPDC059538 TaxID=3346860 RepID=UPI0036CC5B14